MANVAGENGYTIVIQNAKLMVKVPSEFEKTAGEGGIHEIPQ